MRFERRTEIMSELEDLRDKFRKIANGHDNDFFRWAEVIDRHLAKQEETRGEARTKADQSD